MLCRVYVWDWLNVLSWWGILVNLGWDVIVVVMDEEIRISDCFGF